MKCCPCYSLCARGDLYDPSKGMWVNENKVLHEANCHTRNNGDDLLNPYELLIGSTHLLMWRRGATTWSSITIRIVRAI